MGLEDEGLWQVVARGGGSVPSTLHVITISPTLSGQGEVAGVAGLGKDGHRTVAMDAASDRVAGERYVDLPAGVQLRQTALRQGTVALTFDDGPDPRWTPRILEILRRYHARGTFFVIGSQAAQHPDLLRRMYAEGHEVANHTYTHSPGLEHAPAWRFGLELSMTQQVIEAATGHSATLFRYPYSDSLSDPRRDDESLFKVAQQGYQIVGSGADTRDWMRPGAALIMSSALSAPDDQIVLLHDGGGDRAQTVAALPGILAGLQARGLQIVPVGEAIGEPPTAAMPPASQPNLLLDSLVLGTLWTVYHVSSFWFVAVTLVVLLAFARVLILGGFALLHWAAGGRRPANPYRGPVTVLVPAHNEAKVIGRTLQALISSDYPELEIIVVDDGSSDRTAFIASAFGPHGVRVIQVPHSGKAQALRVGFAAAGHPVIVALDADTVVARWTVRRLVEPFGDPRVGAVAGNPKVATGGPY